MCCDQDDCPSMVVEIKKTHVLFMAKKNVDFFCQSVAIRKTVNFFLFICCDQEDSQSFLLICCDQEDY